MKAGRHRSFDKTTALDKAMEIFWKNGYTGTSLTDLTNAMGINKSSLYTAFGNKEELFEHALKMYVEKYGMSHGEHLVSSTKTLSERIENYLLSISKMMTNPDLPGGCMVCNSTSEVGGTRLPSDAHQSVININEVTKSILLDFFKAEKVAGNISSKQSPQVFADYLMTLQFGIAIMAKNGAKHEELKKVIKYSISFI